MSQVIKTKLLTSDDTFSTVAVAYTTLENGEAAEYREVVPDGIARTLYLPEVKEEYYTHLRERLEAQIAGA